MSLQPLYRVEQARALDRRAIAELGIAGYTLMSRAGEAAARWLTEHYPLAQHIVVLAGPGNNGGDGYVMARALRRAGRAVEMLALPSRSSPSVDAAQARSEWQAAGGQTQAWSGQLPLAEIYVDALFGIGLGRALGGEAAAMVAALNAVAVPVLALDLPSGLDADSGQALGPVVRAERTLSFIVDKTGLHTGDAADCCGAIEVADLGLPGAFLASEAPAAERLQAARLQQWLPRRRRTGHKGDYGHVLVVAGEEGYGGAARLAAEAAARGGAGLVSLRTRAAHVAPILAARPELMVRASEQTPAAGQGIGVDADVLVVGPGLGRGDWGRGWLNWALAQARPLVLDADALNLLAADPRPLPAGSIITPHPGEAARLLATTTAQISADRYAAAAELASRYRCVAVLKGAGSLIAAAGQLTRVCPYGNPGMASGGSGDVLAGLTGALLAQGLDPFDAASAGVLAHALAGDAAAVVGERGLLAGDLLAALRPVLNPATD